MILELFDKVIDYQKHGKFIEDGMVFQIYKFKVNDKKINLQIGYKEDGTELFPLLVNRRGALYIQFFATDKKGRFTIDTTRDSDSRTAIDIFSTIVDTVKKELKKHKDCGVIFCSAYEDVKKSLYISLFKRFLSSDWEVNSYKEIVYAIHKDNIV